MYSTMLCTQMNTALTTNIVGSLKNVITMYVGKLVVYGDDLVP